MKKKIATAKGQARNLLMDLDVPRMDSSNLKSDEDPQPVAGTLQIEVLNGTGMPVLSPLPAPTQSLILANTSGGQMAVVAAAAAGTISIAVPDGGSVGINPSIPNTPAQVKISVEKRWEVWTSWPGHPGRTGMWVKDRFVLHDSSANSADAIPANGKRSIDLNGNLSAG